MTDFPGSPRLIKGALVSAEPARPLASVIVFQYNPETMTRRLEARAVGGEDGDRSEAFRISGPPKETITLQVEIDATDQINRVATASLVTGIVPTLSALEVLLYPTSTSVVQNAALARSGEIEIIPPEAPLTLFVWGAGRVLPVRLTSFTITEQAYDGLLNPIRAQVDLSLQVLSYHDLAFDNPGYQIFLTHQRGKEKLAIANLASAAQSVAQSIKII